MCPLQPTQGQSDWEEMSGWISALWPQAINFLLMTMVTGTSGLLGFSLHFVELSFHVHPRLRESLCGRAQGACLVAGRAEVVSHSAMLWERLRPAPSAAESWGQKEANSEPQLDEVVGGDLPPSITLPFIGLSCSFACWHPCLPSFYYFISPLVSPFLYFLSKPCFLLSFCSLSSLYPSSYYSCSLCPSYSVSSFFCYLTSLALWFNILPALLWLLDFSASLQAPHLLYLGPTEGATWILEVLLHYPSLNGN